MSLLKHFVISKSSSCHSPADIANGVGRCSSISRFCRYFDGLLAIVGTMEIVQWGLRLCGSGENTEGKNSFHGIKRILLLLLFLCVQLLNFFMFFLPAFNLVENANVKS